MQHSKASHRILESPNEGQQFTMICFQNDTCPSWHPTLSSLFSYVINHEGILMSEQANNILPTNTANNHTLVFVS